jgi:deazaflavin-dependent oxidoreductase (nitroreductase family)
MSIFGRVTRAAARLSQPIGRLMARLFPLWAIVHYRGRRTGRELSTPVQVRATPSEFLIALPWGSSTQWVRNVQAAGGCTVTWRGIDHAVDSPRVLSLNEAIAFRGWERAALRIVRIHEFLSLRRA